MTLHVHVTQSAIYSMFLSKVNLIIYFAKKKEFVSLYQRKISVAFILSLYK